MYYVDELLENFRISNLVTIFDDIKIIGGWKYTPYGILCNLQFELGGKTVEIDVEVINRNLNYNILLGRP